MRSLFRRLFRSSLVGFAAAYFLDRKRGAARRARAMQMGRSLKAKAISRLDARRAARHSPEGNVVEGRVVEDLALRTGVR
ncbi:MAG TPA: hypothetical protein VM282_04210 [Acidimicrobiales bacterium]|nr:hypothetical protein [Acidimicrobiales bacterium]